MAKKAGEAPKKRGRPPKQGYLPDMEPPSIKEIDESADRLAEARGQRMAYLDIEAKEAETLMALMHKHKLKVYEYDGKRVELSAQEKVKVKKAKDDTNGDGEED